MDRPDPLRSSPSLRSTTSTSSLRGTPTVRVARPFKKVHLASGVSAPSSHYGTGWCLDFERPNSRLTNTYHLDIEDDSSRQQSVVDVDSDSPDKPETDEQELGKCSFHTIKQLSILM
jgi:hypothetical protein